MNKKILIPLIALVLVLCGGIVWLFFSLQEQKQVNEEMQELVEMDKQEMEDEYAHFALQYDEMKTQITNDSIVAQLAQEQEKTEQLLEELKRVKATDAREIARLKKELETVRAVLRDYVMQIDSLNRLNENLMAENSRVNAELEQRTAQVAGLSSEKASLSEKVAIASQLDAAGIQLKLLNKRGKDTCSAHKAIEYTGEETHVTVFWNVSQMLEAGDYRVSIFADGNMIGTRTFSYN